MKARINNESDFSSGSFSSYVSKNWKKCNTVIKLKLEEMAKLDKERYHRENIEWKANMLKDAMKSIERDSVDGPLHYIVNIKLHIYRSTI